jgi:hypothetical protein
MFGADDRADDGNVIVATRAHAAAPNKIRARTLVIRPPDAAPSAVSFRIEQVDSSCAPKWEHSDTTGGRLASRSETGLAKLRAFCME